MRGTLGLGLWLALLACPASLLAADKAEFRTKFDREIAPGRPTLVCTKVDKGPVIDGDVDKDPVWQTCNRTRGAWLQLARKDMSGRQTVVYSCYDKENLYLAFVCEETELGNVRMDGDIGSGPFLGADDSVEATIEVGGLNGDGQVYSYRANSRAFAGAWGGTLSPGPQMGAQIPQCKAVGKFGPNRWMLEMAIPFATIKRGLRDNGLATPARGDVLGLKLARYGAAQQDAKNRMVSTWNTDIIYPYMHICGSNGLLYFEDSNALADGDFSLPQGKSPWKTKGEVTTAPAGRLMLGADAAVTQTVAVHPLSYYLLRVEHEGAAPEILIDGKKLDLKDGQAGLWTTDKQDKIVLAVQAKGQTALKRILMEYQPGEEPPGLYCLTNNYRRPDRNISVIMPNAPDGNYRYVGIDYAGRIIWDDNPAIPECYGHLLHSWAYDYNLRVEDLGGRAGSISFSKGSLTAKHKPVFWLPANPADPVCWGRSPHTVDIDLGQEYYVRGLDILWPGSSIINVQAWGRARETDDWTLIYLSDGEYVHPSDRKPRRGYDRVRGMDSVVRYLRWRATPLIGEGGYPQMDGIQEFRIWGLPKADHAGIKAFKPWVEDKRVPPVSPETATLDGQTPLIVPRPRKMALEDGWFLLNGRTRIVAQDHPEARRVARQIHDEVLTMWQVDVPVAVEGAGADPSADVIYLGLPKLNDKARQLAGAQGIDLDLDKPQGYSMRVTPAGVTILGNDNEGLYYGAQSLLMAMRWRNSADGGSAGLRCMKVLDSPGSVLERGVYHRRPYPVMLIFPEGDTGRIKRICRLLSRFKFNVIYLGPNWRAQNATSIMSPWAKKILPQICREVRQEYHIEIRPTILYEEGEGGGYWEDLSNDAVDIRERDPDEDPRELACSGARSLNLCPLDERTYERHFAKIDEILDDFDHPGKVWMFGQVYTSVDGGARWGQCRRCQKSGKTHEELYAYFINRIAQHLQARQTKGLFRSPWLRFGDRDPKDHRLISIDPNDLPGTLTFDMWPPGNTDLFNNPTARDFVARHFKPGQTANGPIDWPSSERYLQDAPQTETEMMASLCGTSSAVWSQTVSSSLLSDVAEEMWYSPDKRPKKPLDCEELSDFVFRFWFGYDRPGWRAGERPNFIPLDLRRFANHTSRATGAETMESGRSPEIDLRYMPTGIGTLAGVPMDIIDQAQNNGKGLLMLGRSAPGTIPSVAATIQEGAGPIAVGRKLASLVFLRKRWHCRTEGMSFEDTWLRPTCRVVYDDDSWLAVDSFLIWHAGLFADEWDASSDCVRPFYRLGWKGNSPMGNAVTLHTSEWVNPYPEKTIKHIEFFTPDFTDGNGKRVSDMMEAIIAITGVEAVAHDLAVWKNHPRVPLLPPRKKERDGFELKSAGDLQGRANGTWSCNIATASGRVPYTLKPVGATGFDRFGIYDMAHHGGDFHEFGAEIIFDTPLSLQRIELRGPISVGGHWGAYAPRTKKVDVVIEVSADGKVWKEAGRLPGLSADADFIPVDLAGANLKAIRLTGTAAPYREFYYPVQVQGDIFAGPPHYNPSFTWRLIGPLGK